MNFQKLAETYFSRLSIFVAYARERQVKSAALRNDLISAQLFQLIHQRFHRAD